MIVLLLYKYISVSFQMLIHVLNLVIVEFLRSCHQSTGCYSDMSCAPSSSLQEDVLRILCLLPTSEFALVHHFFGRHQLELLRTLGRYLLWSRHLLLTLKSSVGQTFLLFWATQETAELKSLTVRFILSICILFVCQSKELFIYKNN